MIKVILLVFLFVLCAVSEDAKTQASSSSSSKQEYFGSLAERGTLDKNNDHGFTNAEARILQDVFSPDYYEPNIILDYRYLKTGGRGYVRSDGGQILILPIRNHMPPPQNNYDTLLEYLRLKHLEQISKQFIPNSRLRKNYGEYDEEILRENLRENMGGNMRENMGGNMRENMGGHMRENMGGNMRENMGGNMRENIGGNMRENMGGNMRENMGGNMRENMGGNMGGNMRENMGGNMRENMGGNMRENMGSNMRENMGGNMRENMGGNMRENMEGNMRENMGEYMPQDMRGKMKDILKNDRRRTRYRNEKLDRHDIEDKFRSDAELGLALCNH